MTAKQTEARGEPVEFGRVSSSVGKDPDVQGEAQQALLHLICYVQALFLPSE